MKISNNHSTPNFQGVYRLPFSETNNRIILKEILPKYRTVKKDIPQIFYGETPFEEPVHTVMDYIAKENGASKDWLVRNAKNFGLNVQLPEYKHINIISSQQDIDAYSNIIKQTIKKIKQPTWKKILNIFRNNPKDSFPQDAPEQVKKVFLLFENYNKVKNNFNNSFNKKFNVENVANPQELLNKMLSEK